jgi:hypothetical protein
VVVEMDLEVASQGDEVGGNGEGRASTPRGWIDSSAASGGLCTFAT